MHLDAEFALAAVLTREDPRDCMVSNRYATLEEMPAGARIGTSSLRRELMLRARFPQLVIGSIRGNVGTRLAKLDNGEFDALVLAAAGLKRLGFAARIRQIISTEVSLPAPGSGCAGNRNQELGLANGGAAFSHSTMPRRVPLLQPSAVCPADSAAVARCRWPRMRKSRATHSVARAGRQRQDGRYVEAEARGAIADPEALASRVVERLTAARRAAAAGRLVRRAANAGDRHAPGECRPATVRATPSAGIPRALVGLRLISAMRPIRNACARDTGQAERLRPCDLCQRHCRACRAAAAERRLAVRHDDRGSRRVHPSLPSKPN